MAQETGTAVQAPPKPAMLDLLRQPNYRKLWLGQAISSTGDQFTFLALIIVMTQLTGSASAVGILLMVMTVPRFLLGMAAGVFVDRWDRKRLLVFSDAIRGIFSLCLILVATKEHVWMVYPIAFVVSTVGVFSMPARNAVMKQILKPEELVSANILSQTTVTITMVAGSALAGVVVGIFGAAPAFAFDALTFFASAALVAMMTIEHIAKIVAKGQRGSAFWSEFKDGLAFVATSRIVMGMLLVLTVFALASGAANALFAPFLLNTLQATPAQVGVVNAAQGVGMILGGLLAAAFVARLRPNLVIAGGLAAFGVFLALISLTTSYLVVLFLLFMIGVVSTPLNATLAALMQKVVPLEKMGRVAGTMNTSQSVANLAAMGSAGILADAIGPRLVVIGAGIIAIISGLAAIPAIGEEAQPAAETAPSLRMTLATNDDVDQR